MMAHCTEFPVEKPEVSLIPLSEEVIRVEQKVGFNIIRPDHTILSEPDSECSNTNLHLESTHGVLTQHPPNVHTLLSQTLEAAPMASEYTNVLNNCDFLMASRTGSQDPTSFAEREVSQRTVLSRDPEQAMKYVDSDKENMSYCDESIEMNKLGNHEQLCNGSVEKNSECRSARNTTNSAMSVDSDSENSVLGAERSNAYTTLSDTSSNACLKKEMVGPVVSVGSRASSARGMEEFVQAKESANSSFSELDTVGGNEASRRGELTNQLIEGPRITLPPSQLPVVPSYPSPHHQRQSTCSVSSSSGMSGVQNNTPAGNLTYVQAVTQNTDSNSSKTVRSEDNAPAHVCIVQREAPAGAVQHSSSSTNRESTLQTTAAAVSESVSEQAISTLSTAETTSAGKPKAKRTPNDFIFGKVIGEGSYSTVYLAKEVSSQREFAIKVCDKKHLIRERKTHFVMREKEVLMKLDHPFFIKLAYTFQDSERLYYVLTYARNGELLGYLHKLSAFDVPCTRFYSAEIVLALEYLHSLGIIHRDLKPENILISEDMHIKITDFGTSKILSVDSEVKAENQVETKRKNSFVGTAEYVSPEVLNNQPANFGSDLWALGCIIYQCLSGSLPFRSGNEYQTFQKIVKAEYEFPEGFHPDAKDLVQKLLVLNPAARLGMVKPEGMKALKNHPFYEDINWETLPDDTPPKLMPYLPATANNPEFWGQEQRAGFDDQRLAEIITGQTADGSISPELEEVPIKMLTQAEDAERAEKLRKQRLENPFNHFVQNNLIIKQGFVDKRKGLFARKRMLLLTEGPHLYYVDAHNKVLKGEIPWSKYLRPEAKNFKIFFVHTPNRTYYLESRQPDAQDWVKQIKEVWKRYYDNGKDKSGDIENRIKLTENKK